MPKLGMYGIQRIHLLRNVMILAGAGVGGGSLNYANTLYVPPDPFFNDPQWKDITDWRAELMPHYEQAQRMLGVVQNPTFTDADKVLKEVADDMGVGDTFVPTPVGVFFGRRAPRRPGKTVPTRTSAAPGPTAPAASSAALHDRLPLRCQEHPGEELPGPGGIRWRTGPSDDDGDRLRAAARRLWEVAPSRTGLLRRKRRTFTATHLVLAAGTFGTQKLLFKMRDGGKLPKLSDRLGVLTRTNSESIVGAGRFEVRRDLDLTHGVAITSSIHPRPRTRISSPSATARAPTRWALLQTLMTDGGGPQGTDVPRWQLPAAGRRGSKEMLRMLNPRHGGASGP